MRVACPVSLVRMPDVDVVIVSYNSGDSLRACVTPLAASPGINVVVVDNASPDGALDSIDDIDVDRVQLDRNGGFSHGCNVGWRRGSARFVLFLNPDAIIVPASVTLLQREFESDEGVGIAAPFIRDANGNIDYSQRRYPRLRSTFARALYLHRIIGEASWVDELVRDEDAYRRTASPDWVSGACLMIPRELLMKLDGWDERFFMYCEDIDLCRRVRDLGLDVRFVPEATVVHEGGASAPRPALLPVLAESRVLYARKHRSAAGAVGERLGLALEATTRLAVTQGGGAARRGHARSLAVIAGRKRVQPN
jgi:N-acetylglucosaminyl-diphospho-decaprenol L-rhamnosyltransferase